MAAVDLKALIKRVFELVMPDLRAYYRIVRKASVVKCYASDGQYWADVQPLRNDDSIDDSEPVIQKVEIPVIWGGPERGIVCPPEVGVLCDLTYYDGDPDHPRISNFRWKSMAAPCIEIGGFIIQREPGTFIKIDSNNNIICETPTDSRSTVGGDWAIKVDGKADVEAGVSATITAPVVDVVASTKASITAPQINMTGNMSIAGTGGGVGSENKKANTNQVGSFALTGNLSVAGNISATGTVSDSAGNTNHHSHP